MLPFFLIVPQVYPGALRVGSKPVASAPSFLLLHLVSPPFLTTPQ